MFANPFGHVQDEIKVNQFPIAHMQSHVIYVFHQEKMVSLAPLHIDGLVQERRNSIANALELRLSCTNP